MQQVNDIMLQAAEAFKKYRKISGKEKAVFLRTIADEIEALGMELIQTAMEETNLPEARLLGERGRTIFQLNTFANLLEEGSWVAARIDTADPHRQPIPKVDLRKMLVPIGTVAVFGASNFPFAYSTAGGDTASALAAGCPVVVKGHPAHARTSAMVAKAVLNAVERTNMPEGVFAHLESGDGFEVGRALVMHPETKAVGFTGSFAGGKALFDMANQRKEPIPVFSEMGSVNPVILMPEKMANDAENVAFIYANSITLGVGQFCTNPGLIIGIENENLEKFMDVLSDEIEKVVPATMLNTGIYKNFEAKKSLALAQDGVITESVSKIEKTVEIQGTATIASVSADVFLKNPTLHQEVFGPFSLVVKCKDLAQLTEVLGHLEGQLTATLMATESELQTNEEIVDILRNISGRLNFNNVPTGVEVCFAMQHGGPFPASTDGRFTSVGPDAIKRFVRPASYQSFPDSLLPDELKQNNPLNIWRMVDNEWTK
ncbi:NADP-dependent aldehyde dehydrogenase [Arcicella aurantiaca]|uniref:NADP-dependent aldehyde dehydrogenase n=1 Tax=Arcicella aurantiaca TaxID=591202 RepID=A0A316EA58_9BACT|nr:aldehyde dehydrogenase (NADP(+)) [Arcicella aurantiaca]PWK27335.1 NADP-dependent aldehyde dehydrogenase [Arcicella aurantiaca]